MLKNKKTIKKAVRKKVKRMRPRGIRPLKPAEFLEIMGRLELIDAEMKKEKELFDIKIKSLKLEKEYLKNRFKEKKERKINLKKNNALDIKIKLADKYIDNTKQREIFLNQATQFKQWANYIAGLVLTQEGKKIFTPTDVKVILRGRLIPDYYDEPGFKEGSLLTQDVEIKSKYHEGYPSLKRINRGRYKFIGFVCGRKKLTKSAMRKPTVKRQKNENKKDN